MDREANNRQAQIICRGVRGATLALADSREEIHSATTELIEAILATNGIHPDDLASAFFTTTPDLHSAFPAEAARHMAGWEYVPMIGATEMDKPGALTRCIRALLHWNTTKGQKEIRHIYLRGTESLRADDTAQAKTLR
ncbi:MAG: chorismate mutase [Chloroflexi bacterium]|nr:chorismate mutase [Chloroflexota bacterium]